MLPESHAQNDTVVFNLHLLIIYRVNLGPLVAKGILVCLVKKETLDPLALKGLLVLLVIKGHQVLKVQLVRVAIQVFYFQNITLMAIILFLIDTCAPRAEYRLKLSWSRVQSEVCIKLH